MNPEKNLTKPKLEQLPEMQEFVLNKIYDDIENGESAQYIFFHHLNALSENFKIPDYLIEKTGILYSKCYERKV